MRNAGRLEKREGLLVLRHGGCWHQREWAHCPDPRVGRTHRVSLEPQSLSRKVRVRKLESCSFFPRRRRGAEKGTGCPTSIPNPSGHAGSSRPRTNMIAEPKQSKPMDSKTNILFSTRRANSKMEEYADPERTADMKSSSVAEWDNPAKNDNL